VPTHTHADAANAGTFTSGVIIGDGNNGSWKIVSNGSELIFQYKVSGTYEEVSKISYIP